MILFLAAQTPYEPTDDWSLYQTLGQLFLMIVVFVIILALAYFATKFYARGGLRKGKNIETLESMSLTATSSVRLVRVGRKYFLLGITKERISFLSEVEGDSIDTDYSKDALSANALTALMQKYQKTDGDSTRKPPEKSDEKES